MLFDKSLLQQVLVAYKDVFVSKQWPNEKYKWIAVKHFQDNWDIDAPDFAAMLKNALAKTGNLLVAVNTFPARMIIEFAEVDFCISLQRNHGACMGNARNITSHSISNYV